MYLLNVIVCENNFNISKHRFTNEKLKIGEKDFDIPNLNSGKINCNLYKNDQNAVLYYYEYFDF